MTTEPTVTIPAREPAPVPAMPAKSGTPPHLTNWPLIHNMPDFLMPLLTDTFYLYYRNLNRTLGPIMTHFIFDRVENYVSDPTEMKRILTSKEFRRNDFFLKVTPDVFGYALFAMETGPVWQKHRKAIVSGMGPQFVRKAYGVTVDLVQDLTRMFDAHIASSEDGSFVMNIREYLSLLTLDVLTRVAFSHDMNCLQGFDDLKSGKDSVDKRSVQLRTYVDEIGRIGIYRTFVPKFLWGFFKISETDVVPIATYFDAMINEFLAPRRQKAEEGEEEESESDLLTPLLKKTEDGEMLFSDKEIRDECMALMFAGHDTTSNTITNVFLQLCQHPDALKTLRHEIDANYPPGTTEFPRLDELSKFEYLDYVFKETQRTKNILMGLDRVVASENMEMLGYKFKKNDYFSANLQTVFLDPQYWGPDAEEFKPERWINKEVVDGTFMPFGAGQHMCPGMKMAIMEAKVVLIQLLRTFDFELIPGQKLELVDGIVCHLPNGLELKVTKRREE
ncbi:hypothetical protein HDU79_000878 [Rhizoclosmatium sp. JEL0117]|nr:hypothetical protein HDU79_000878 [Rhizoclosmatium sp. JEL0117]